MTSVVRVAFSAATAVLAVAAVVTRAENSAPPLPQVSIRPDTVTLSGFDSGAIFATQYQFSFSDEIRGAGLATPVPWACAQNTISGGDACMTDPYIIDMDLFYAEAAKQESLGNLANLTNIASHYVSVQSAPLDPLVAHDTSILAEQMYGQYGVTAIDTVYSMPNGDTGTHAWVTSRYGNPCSYLGDPYVNNCGFDYAGHILTGLFRHMNQPFTPAPANFTFNSSYLYEFNQEAFGASGLVNSMAGTGYAFIPPQCIAGANGTAAAECHLHLHFHGCRQSRATVGAAYVSQTELNEHAQLNNIMVLYPQATPNDILLNPLGCWDWFGYCKPLEVLAYATNKGVQTRMIRAIVRALVAGFAQPHQRL